MVIKCGQPSMSMSLFQNGNYCSLIDSLLGVKCDQGYQYPQTTKGYKSLTGLGTECLTTKIISTPHSIGKQLIVQKSHKTGPPHKIILENIPDSSPAFLVFQDNL